MDEPEVNSILSSVGSSGCGHDFVYKGERVQTIIVFNTVVTSSFGLRDPRLDLQLVLFHPAEPSLNHDVTAHI